MSEKIENRRVKLLDVAERAGVSQTTASFVMTGRRGMRISADTEHRVLQAARELNYRPNLLARSLRTTLTQTIGLLSDQIASGGFAGEIIRGATTTSLLRDHLLFVGETQGDPEVEKQVVQAMIDRGVGGFVYASMYTRTVRINKALRSHRLVLLNSVNRGKAFPTVVPDEVGAGRAAASVLLDHGHRRGIVLVGEQPTTVVAAQERLTGIRQALAEQDGELAATLDTTWWPEPARRVVRDHLAAGHRPSAFICLNDRVAMGTYQAITEMGLRVPEDISVISFDGSDLASWLHPTVTSVAIPHFEMGRRAVELLLDPEPDPTVHRIPMPVQHGESIGPPAGD